MGPALLQIHFPDYQKSIISRINEFYISCLLQSHLFLCWYGFCDVSVTLCNVSVTLSKKLIDVHPRSDSTEFTEAVPIEDLQCSRISFLSPNSLISNFDKVQINRSHYAHDQFRHFSRNRMTNMYMCCYYKTYLERLAFCNKFYD